MAGKIESGVERAKRIKPFLRWAGGKQQILDELVKRLPKDVKERRYHEPFLGGGSLFFALQPGRAFLSDANEHLIRCYEYVRDCPESISGYLREHARKSGKDYYYQTREIYNKSKFSPAQAARFIYLNKTCFNGIFRVNQDGLFNVPYGRKEPPALPAPDHLREASCALKSAKLFSRVFEKALESVAKGDFVYLDPPYPALNTTSYFTHYTRDKFNDKDQERLAAVVRNLQAAGCLFMVSNAKTRKIGRLYKQFNKLTLPVTRYITCKSVRHEVKELVITNY